MFQERGVKRPRADSSPTTMSDCDAGSGLPMVNGVGPNGPSTSAGGVGLENNPEHSMRIMHGLNKLKRDRVLCDVTLIAEGNQEFVFSTFRIYFYYFF